VRVREAALFGIQTRFGAGPTRPLLRTGCLEKVEIGELQVPVVTNVEAKVNRDAGRVRRLLVEQVCAPVRWEESVACLVTEGVDRFVEIGPGKVLAGLIKRMARGTRIETFGAVAELDALRS